MEHRQVQRIEPPQSHFSPPTFKLPVANTNNRRYLILLFLGLLGGIILFIVIFGCLLL